jgi:hypothetical protein
MSRDGILKKNHMRSKHILYYRIQAIIKHFKDTELPSIFFQLNFFHLLQVNFLN